MQGIIIPLAQLPKATSDVAWAGIRESARLWNDCRELFWTAIRSKSPWPNQNQLQLVTKGQYALHSQSVQMLAKSVRTAFRITRLLRLTHPEMRMRYPYRQKHHHCLLWPAQAVRFQGGKAILPMGNGQPDLVLPLGRELPFAPGACKLLWQDGWELHITSLIKRLPEGEKPPKPPQPGTERATGDLGEIHLIAVVTSTGKALVVSGRGIRSIKRRRCMELAHLAAKRSHCKPGSKRDRKLARARRKLSRRTRFQVRDLRHKGLRSAIDFCVREKVGSLYVGNPDGVRRRKAGAVHNGRMARWEYGKDLNLLEHKCGLAGIDFRSGTERGTSSHCPVCQHPQRPAGRNFTCQQCGATLHRDVLGGVNQHQLGFGQPVPIPTSIKYLRPGGVSLRPGTGNEDPVLASSSRPDTGLPDNPGLLSCGAGEPGSRLAKTAPDVGAENQALPAREGCIRISPQVCSEAQEARCL